MNKNQEKSKVELIKENSCGLRGSIAEELSQEGPTFSAQNTALLKFHGIYQQEDRDQRKERSRLRMDKAHQFMVRIKNPGGGKFSPEQWLALDRAADLYGNNSLRLTSRQDVQFHGVGKRNLRQLIRLLDSQLISTYGACGDGVRNTLACPVSSIREDSCFDGQVWARQIAQRFAFRSTAYYEIWMDGESLTPVTEEPLYGKAYLPRKLKIAIADPRDNCVDVYTNDIGIIPAFRELQLIGFHILVGGGLGSTHAKKETYPRLATHLCLVSAAEMVDVVEAIVATERDLGDRQNRKHARLKYLVEEMGIMDFRREVEARLERQLLEPRPMVLSHGETHLGWHRQNNSELHYVGLFVENGRVRDCNGTGFKSGLREIAGRFHPNILLTPRQDLVLCDIAGTTVQEIQSVLRHFGIVPEQEYSPLRIRSMACPALPTCGLAISEAERRLPGLVTELERRGFGNEAVVMRMAGCPNSCSRPPVAEIGLIGKSVNGYHVYVGGSACGTRLAQLYQEDVPSEQLADLIAELFTNYRKHRMAEEAFGDWACRIGIPQLCQLCCRPLTISLANRILETAR